MGFQAIAKICDIWNVCTDGLSAPFIVEHSRNAIEAFNSIERGIREAIESGNILTAVELFDIYHSEKCSPLNDSIVGDILLTMLLDTYKNTK